jgi:hypothetical protein
MKETPQSITDLSNRILTVRGQRVIVDSELAQLYGVSTRQFNQAIRRNLQRFPKDFCFALTKHEVTNLKSQIVISSSEGHGGRRSSPLVFTEHGVIMAAGVLNSQRAIDISVFVVRAFVQMRKMLDGQQEVMRRLDELEERIEKRLNSHDQAISEIFTAIRGLMAIPDRKNRPIGFITSGRKGNEVKS